MDFPQAAKRPPMKFVFPQGYAPNVALGTGNNLALRLEAGGLYTFRALIRPLRPGRMNWRFFYWNQVDSTWDDGSQSRAGLPGGAFGIVSAWAGVCADAEAPVSGARRVRFEGREQRGVEPGGQVCSDPVELNCPEGGYIAFSWCLECAPGAAIPGTPNSQALCFTAKGDLSARPTLSGFAPAGGEGWVALPNLWAAERPFIARIGFLGDSITQGCGTRPDFYEHWAARILTQLGQTLGGWNLGLGFGRAQDAARGESWLSKAAALDHVCVCLGVNDILQGRTAQALWADLCAIRAGLRRANPGLRLTQFTIPPFDLEGGHLEIWRQINGGLRDLARKGEIELFDIAQVLARPHPNGHLAAFGPHPDGAGGAAVCRSFMDWLTSTSKNKEEN